MLKYVKAVLKLINKVVVSSLIVKLIATHTPNYSTFIHKSAAQADT